MRKFKIRSGIVLVSIREEYMLIATREARKKCPYVQQINSVAAFYWKLMENGSDIKKIIKEASIKYQLSWDNAVYAVKDFYKKMYHAGYLVLEEETD